jgi:hypothetical protein
LPQNMNFRSLRVGFYPLLLLAFICPSFPTYSQQPLYKEGLPSMVHLAHSAIETGFSNISRKLDDSTFMQYASYRFSYQSTLDETLTLYKQRDYDRLQKQMTYWVESIQKDLGEPADMPSARKAELIEAMEVQRLDTGPVMTAFEKFIEAYTLYQKKVWMRKVTDSTKIVTEYYIGKLNALQAEIDKSKVKKDLEGLSGRLHRVQVYQDLADFSVIVKGLLGTINSSKPYLDDENFYQMTLLQKVNAKWKPENVVDFGNTVFEAVKTNNLKGYSKYFLSYAEAEGMYRKSFAGFNQEYYTRMLEQARASFQEVIDKLKNEGIMPGTVELISDYKSLSYMNTITNEQRKSDPMNYDIYIVFGSAKGKYLLTLKEVENNSVKQKVKHLSVLDLTPFP